MNKCRLDRVPVNTAPAGRARRLNWLGFRCTLASTCPAPTSAASGAQAQAGYTPTLCQRPFHLFHRIRRSVGRSAVEPVLLSDIMMRTRVLSGLGRTASIKCLLSATGTGSGTPRHWHRLKSHYRTRIHIKYYIVLVILSLH